MLSLFIFLMVRRPPRSTLFPSPTLFRSAVGHPQPVRRDADEVALDAAAVAVVDLAKLAQLHADAVAADDVSRAGGGADRKSTRLNSSHANISYAVFCLKKNTYPIPSSPS